MKFNTSSRQILVRFESITLLLCASDNNPFINVVYINFMLLLYNIFLDYSPLPFSHLYKVSSKALDVVCRIVPSVKTNIFYNMGLK